MKLVSILPVMALLLCVVAPASGQSWGLGMRLGDPSGITIKRYWVGKAFELNLGRTRAWYKDDWYDQRFYKWYDDKGFGYEEIHYEGYRSRAPLAAQFHYLIHQSLGQAGRKGQGYLDWYYGFGGQARFNTYYYNYRYKVKGSGWIYVTEERVPDIDLGVDAVIGLEYKFKAPISLFLDLTLFMEVLDDPFLFRTQGGLGGRFRF